MKPPRLKLNGWIALDKPYGMSSTQAVGKVRFLLNADKAGHGGTLDPLASGLLPIALGEATKTVQWAMDGRKVYRFRAQWGSETTTDDLEGEVTKRSDLRPTLEAIAAALPRFIGSIMQAPPAYSAIKIDGERAYDLARAGAAPEMHERQVHVEALVLVEATADYADFEVTCGKGTYIRSLARDLGRVLGCFAHVTVLRRIQVGGLKEPQMISLEMLATLGHKAALPIETVLDGIPALAITEADAAKLRQGQTVLLRGASAPISEAAVLVRCGPDLVGIGEIAQGILKTKRLFNL